MKDYSLDEQKLVFKGAYKSFRKRVKDLGEFGIAFSENDGRALLLSLELLVTSRLNMSDSESECAEDL